MTLTYSRRSIRVAGLLVVLGCEVVAPLKAPPESDSGVSGSAGGAAGSGMGGGSGLGGVMGGGAGGGSGIGGEAGTSADGASGIGGAMAGTGAGGTSGIGAGEGGSSAGGASGIGGSVMVTGGEPSGAGGTSGSGGGVAGIGGVAGSTSAGGTSGTGGAVAGIGGSVAGNGAGGASGVGGRGGNGGGHGVATVVTCDSSMPFGQPILVNGLNRDLGTEQDVTLSPDELTAYLAIGRNVAETDIFTAKRGSTMQPFGSPVPIFPVNTVAPEMSVSITGDGLTLFFDRSQSGFTRVYVATRSTTESQFGSPRELVLYSVEAHQFDPYVLPDGSALYFASNAPEYGLYRAALNGTNVELPVQVKRDGSRFPVVSQDEMTLYSMTNFNENLEMQIATRPSRDVAFGASTLLTNLNTANANEAPGWISPDGCRLYFTRALPREFSVSLFAERMHK
jgi:hypothetical protein